MSIPLSMQPERRYPDFLFLVSSSLLNDRPLLTQHWIARLFRTPVQATDIKVHAVRSRFMNDTNTTAVMTLESAAQTPNGRSTSI